MINLTACVSGGCVVIAFGTVTVDIVPLTQEQQYLISNTGTGEDELAAEVAASWLRQGLSIPT